MSYGLGIVLAGIYVAIKTFGGIQKITSYVAFLKDFLSETSYGELISAEKLLEMGQAETDCTICQEKLTRPILLPCNHLFCDECITEWFERGEKTCPMCRAVNQNAGRASAYTDGTQNLTPIIF